jgi:linoleoyl-CoA desaturase
VQRTILRLAFPGGTPRPKPGPFRGDGETADHATQSGEDAFLRDRGVAAQS